MLVATDVGMVQKCQRPIRSLHQREWCARHQPQYTPGRLTRSLARSPCVCLVLLSARVSPIEGTNSSIDPTGLHEPGATLGTPAPASEWQDLDPCDQIRIVSKLNVGTTAGRLDQC